MNLPEIRIGKIIRQGGLLGEIYGLLGANGSETTTVGIISGLIAADGGRFRRQRCTPIR
jgi:ABC-type lipopolysaccharide export system ATPase subunit